MNAVDTNVFVYALDADEPVKQAQAIDLLDQLIADTVETVLHWQVAVEYLSCLRRWESAGKIVADDVEANLIDLLATFRLVTPGRAVLDLSIDLCGRFSLSHWDSLLIAACLEAGVDTLYTEDMDAGTTFDTLKLINPFASP